MANANANLPYRVAYHVVGLAPHHADTVAEGVRHRLFGQKKILCVASSRLAESPRAKERDCRVILNAAPVAAVMDFGCSCDHWLTLDCIPVAWAAWETWFFALVMESGNPSRRLLRWLRLNAKKLISGA